MLTKDKQVQSRIPAIFAHPIAADTEIFKGSLTVINAAGAASSATKAPDLKAVGIARKGVSNKGGAEGEKLIEVRRDESPRMKNDAVSPVTREHIGEPCYIIDDETVTSDETGSSIAGTVANVDDDGVWITF